MPAHVLDSRAAAGRRGSAPAAARPRAARRSPRPPRCAARGRAVAGASSIGKGHRVCGRKSPAAMPAARSCAPRPSPSAPACCRPREHVGVVAADTDRPAAPPRRSVRTCDAAAGCAAPGRAPQEDRAIRLPRCGRVAADRPRGQAGPDQLRGQPHLARHLAQVAVGDDDDRVAVSEGEVEREHGEVEHLLRRGRGQHDRVRVPVTEPTAGQLDVRLLGPDVAQARARRASRRRTTPGSSAPIMYEIPSSIRLKPGDEVKVMAGQAGPAAPVHHVDCRDLARRPAGRRHPAGAELRHQLRALGGRGDGVAEDVTAAREQRAEGGGVRALRRRAARARGAAGALPGSPPARPLRPAQGRRDAAGPPRAARRGRRRRGRTAPGRRPRTASSRCSRPGAWSTGANPLAGLISVPQVMQARAHASMQRPQALQ